ncbi:OsmC family protein [Actinomycetospora flava]|uniref:OsmC family protein n=1 Tax=Actinomycetospora flava TaxID=3129232 RepID=A0ABU8M3A1_9PSEU
MAIKPKETVVPFAVHGEGTGVAQTLTAGGHVFTTDAYPAFGGADAAPSPLFYALGALTSCNQVTAALVAKDLGVTLGNWTFDIQGDLDTAVLVGGAEGNANFDKVAVRATVETDASEEQFATLISETERRCPVTQLFQRSGLEFVNDWTRAELPAAV